MFTNYIFVFRAILILLFLASDSSSDSNVRVWTDAGNVMYRKGQETVRLTSEGLDEAPWLSIDGKSVVYIRQSPVDKWKASVWKSDVETRTENQVFGGPVTLNGAAISSFTSAQLSLDQRTLYVLLDTGVATADMAAIDLTTLAPRYFAACAGFDIIRAGEHQGDLILLKRSRDINGFPFYLYWLHSADGRELGIAGPDDMDLDDAINGFSLENDASQTSGSLEPSGAADSRWKTAAHVPDEAASGQLLFGTLPGKLTISPRTSATAEVNLQVLIGESGAVVDVRLVSGPPAQAGAALKAVRGWRYRPFVIEGRPTSVITKVRLAVSDR